MRHIKDEVFTSSETNQYQKKKEKEKRKSINLASENCLEKPSVDSHETEFIIGKFQRMVIEDEIQQDYNFTSQTVKLNFRLGKENSPSGWKE